MACEPLVVRKKVDMFQAWYTFRGYLAGVVAFIACPCHLPLTLPLLISLTAGTAFGVWIANNVILIGAISTGFFIGGLALAFKWLTQPACPPNPKATPSLSQSKNAPMK